ncbi:hypothetical protein KIN20_025449 [Parelaphostrongylus tenuis]|uniref:Uncharacterized protein n=1 Tax=Parelaphostrongylus tenuis TaxID=148309 RepID=A0AAD5MV91_PARTN|nr:hypothetical protein KIN20_025449 [Parelaphostrongylus tenuis]
MITYAIPRHHSICDNKCLEDKATSLRIHVDINLTLGKVAKQITAEKWVLKQIHCVIR